MTRINNVTARAKRRAMRVRRKLRVSNRPRLSVFRSARYIYCQLIDDEQSRTVAQADSMKPVRSGQLTSGGNVDAAKFVGREIAEKAKQAGVEQVVFDRGPYKYHGRIKALAEAAREAGLKF
jgi:large subunit ribosomal protein L18